MVTLKDIATRCGVSVSAVSLAIHKPHKISRELKESVLKVAHELGYFKQKDPDINRVLLVFNSLYNSYASEYYNMALYGILNSLYKEHVAIQILDDFNNVEYSTIYENSGIVFVDRVPEHFIEKAIKFKMPFVLCGHPDEKNEHPVVRFNVERGISELLDYVISCGHQKIGLLIPEFAIENDPIKNIIIESYKKALEANGIAFDKKMIAEAAYNNALKTETGLNKLLQNKPTAIFCSNDHLAYSSYQFFRKLKINVPVDISIVGFDGLSLPSYLEYPSPALTTVSTDQIALGREAISLLKKLIINPNTEEKQVVLPVTLRIGDSVSRIPIKKKSK